MFFETSVRLTGPTLSLSPGRYRAAPITRVGRPACVAAPGFETDDLDSVAARLKEDGVKFRREPGIAGCAINRLMFVYDADFNQVEIIQRDVDW